MHRSGAVGYAGDMNAILPFSTPRLHVLAAPHSETNRFITVLLSRLALAGGAQVLDGGNCFDVHALARSLRSQTVALEAALCRVHVARVFTCVQASVRLSQIPVQPTPLIVLSLLTTFGDENVAHRERARLLELCLKDLQRLAQAAPVLVTARPDSEFLPRLKAAADVFWEAEE